MQYIVCRKFCTYLYYLQLCFEIWMYLSYGYLIILRWSLLKLKIIYSNIVISVLLDTYCAISLPNLLTVNYVHVYLSDILKCKEWKTVLLICLVIIFCDLWSANWSIVFQYQVFICQLKECKDSLFSYPPTT